MAEVLTTTETPLVTGADGVVRVRGTRVIRAQNAGLTGIDDENFWRGPLSKGEFS